MKEGPFEVGNQVLISSHRKLLWSKAMVVRRMTADHYAVSVLPIDLPASSFSAQIVTLKNRTLSPVVERCTGAVITRTQHLRYLPSPRFPPMP